jgi:demethylmenaquinone methyltransferase/2-methoxy-6-polyprenyl-1,4-benzoquinol methylase
MPKGKAVQSMFAEISGKYDSANHILSGGIDFYWRRVLVSLVRKTGPQSIADLATGSGDVAFALAKAIPQASIVGLDFCEPMLEEARQKQNKRPPEKRIEFKFGDCLQLPMEDNSVDAITIAFGLRNLEDRHAGLVEMKRVLRPGGSLFVLEFTQPDKWFRPIYYIYLKAILPIMARIATGNRSAYDYLAGSIESFPSKSQISGEILDAGFKECKAIGLSASIVAIHHALTPPTDMTTD